MKVYAGIDQLSQSFERPVLTIGNFDGVHRGHQSIIARAVEKARERKGTAVAFTFRPHPQVALRPGANLPLLTTYDEKLELLGALGLDAVIEEPFSRKFSTVEPQEFFTEVVLRAVGAEAIVVGYDFAFGKGRSGHLAALEEFCKGAGVELEIIAPQRVEQEVASSSKIRQHLMSGQIPAASHLLGRDFFYRGVVIKGDGRGRTIGFPTANLKIDDKLALPYGVYATRAVLGGPSGVTVHHSVTNVGVRPTFKPGPGELHALVETHLLDFSRDLYGTTIEVRFLAKLRDERKFAGIDELKTQIARDVIQARGLLGKGTP